jgi:hypothetical protein
MVFPVATIHLRAQPATWPGLSSIGMKNFSPPRPSDFTRAAMGRRHMRNSFKRLSKRIKAEAAKKEPSPQGPRSIEKVFAARHLSKSGPASYGNAAFGFEDIMFVDIGLYLHNGEGAMNRTLVIKDRDGKWYVHPAPSASPLLSEGLNEEKASVLDLTDVYD